MRDTRKEGEPKKEMNKARSKLSPWPYIRNNRVRTTALIVSLSVFILMMYVVNYVIGGMDEPFYAGDVAPYERLQIVSSTLGMNGEDYESDEEYMEEGCEKGCSLCMMYQSDMSEDDFKSLSESMQTQIYKNIDERLNRGYQMGEGICCYYLWHHYYYGTHGFTKDIAKAFTYLQRGVELYDMFCAEQMGIEALQGNLPETISLSLAEIGELWLQVARFDPLNVDAVIQLCELDDPTFKLKHKEEIEKYWEPIYKSYWAENKELDSQHDDWRLFDDDWRTDDDDYEDDDGRYDAYV